jgi:hypothetical protein
MAQPFGYAEPPFNSHNSKPNLNPSDGQSQVAASHNPKTCGDLAVEDRKYLKEVIY